LIAGFQHPNAFVDVRQADSQRKPFTLTALDGKLAAVLAHDATHNQ
jgi:hypothetical protein